LISDSVFFLVLWRRWKKPDYLCDPQHTEEAGKNLTTSTTCVIHNFSQFDLLCFLRRDMFIPSHNTLKQCNKLILIATGKLRRNYRNFFAV